MTSKRLFLRFFKENLKRWPGMLVLSLYLTAVYVVDFLMAWQNIVLVRGDDRLGPANEMAFWITVIMGAACAFQGFGFLFSEKKTDFYLGLPLRRSTLYWANYVSGILAGIVPCILGRVLCMFVQGDRIPGSGGLLLAGIAVNLLGFLFFYHVTMLLIFVTGKFVAALLGLALVWGYGTLIVGSIAEKYSEVFFNTFYRINALDTLKVYTSPGELYRKLTGVEEYLNTEVWKFSEKAFFIFVMLGAVALLALAVRILFQRRPAEGAGKVLVFTKTKAAVKLLLAIPASLLTGYYLMKCSPDGKSAILLFSGILISAFAVNGALEALLEMDIRAFFLRKRHVLYTVFLGLGAASVFYLDLFHYDSTVPASEQVEAAALAVEGIDDGTSLRGETFQPDEQLERMRLTGKTKEMVLDWAGQLAETKSQDSDGITVVAAFYKKDGTCIYRKYEAGRDQLEDFAEIYEREDYKQGSASLAACEKAGRKIFTWTNGAEVWQMDLNDEEKAELLKDYREELAKVKFSDTARQTGNGVLSLAPEMGGGGFEGIVYPDFEKTLDFMERQGVPAGKRIQDYEVTRMEIKWEEDNAEHSDDVVTDKEMIEKLKPYVIPDSVAVNPSLRPVENCRVIVKYKYEGSNTFGIAECRIETGVLEEMGGER